MRKLTIRLRACVLLFFAQRGDVLSAKTIVFLGDSLTAGLALEQSAPTRR